MMMICNKQHITMVFDSSSTSSSPSRAPAPRACNAILAGNCHTFCLKVAEIKVLCFKKQIFPHFSPNYNPLCYVHLQINLFEKRNNFRGDKKEVKLSNKKLSATLSVTQQFFSYSHVYICNNTYEGTMLILFILLQSSLVKKQL